MNNETFEEGLKILKRFLKDEGLYQQVFKNFLFKEGRPKIDLFQEFNSTIFPYVDGWTNVFKYINLMKGRNEHFDFLQWKKFFENTDLDSKWQKYYINRINKNDVYPF